tara:strand:- start:219 stop:500 length:282 start_codon:yes stop_codon:yes gene_type:complete
MYKIFSPSYQQLENDNKHLRYELARFYGAYYDEVKYTIHLRKYILDLKDKLNHDIQQKKIKKLNKKVKKLRYELKCLKKQKKMNKILEIDMNY